MNDTVRQFRDFFVSLKLTVVLLVLGLLLVFAATIDQVNLGVWGIQKKWFHSFFVLQEMKGFPVPIFPGGYLIGGLLLINLIAAHVYRFKFTWRKAGIFLTHVGLILLLLGELITGILQDDYAMTIPEGGSKSYAEHHHENELALVDTTDPATDEVVAIPQPLLAPGKELPHPKLPFRVIVRDYFSNADYELVSGRTAQLADGTRRPTAPTRDGRRVAAMPAPETYKPNERNLPAAVIEILDGTDSLGTWLVTTAPAIPPQPFEHQGRRWTIQFRPARAYYPFSLKLLDFSFDRYAGTNIPKNYSSQLVLSDPTRNEEREVLIYMNNPLRYAGLTFYQADFDHETEKATILQVVRNPGWLMPYIACGLMTFGLLLQFIFHLVGFVGKRRAVA